MLLPQAMMRLLTLLAGIAAAFCLGCQSTTTVNDGYGMTFEDDSSAEQVQIDK